MFLGHFFLFFSFFSFLTFWRNEFFFSFFFSYFPLSSFNSLSLIRLLLPISVWASLLSSLSAPPSLTSPPLYHSPFLLREGEPSHGYHAALAYQVVVGLGASSSIESRQSHPVRGRDPETGNWTAPAPAMHLLRVFRGLSPSHACSLVRGLVSVSPLGPRLVDSVGCLEVSLTSLASSVLHPPLPQESLSSAQRVSVGLCVCFHQLMGKATQMAVMLGSWSASIAEYY